MSANGTITIIWTGGEHQFCLAKVGHILDLEHKCGAGIGAIKQRLEMGAWGLNDVRETIRLGLIGGGMAPNDAMTLVKNNVDEHPLATSVLLAYEILKAVMLGVPDDVVGQAKKEEPAEAAQPGFSTTTDASDDLKS